MVWTSSAEGCQGRYPEPAGQPCLRAAVTACLHWLRLFVLHQDRHHWQRSSRCIVVGTLAELPKACACTLAKDDICIQARFNQPKSSYWAYVLSSSGLSARAERSQARQNGKPGTWARCSTHRVARRPNQHFRKFVLSRLPPGYLQVAPAEPSMVSRCLPRVSTWGALPTPRYLVLYHGGEAVAFCCRYMMAPGPSSLGFCYISQA
jgi:hypothetical protein